MDRIDQAMRGADLAPLTTMQRRLLMARLVVPAWKAMRAKGLAGESLEDWRREEQFKACHKEHLRACTQEDYPRLRAHFLRLLGRVEESRQWERRSLGGNLDVARVKLRQALAEAGPVLGDARAYAAAICRSKFKTTDMDALTSRQVWVLVFDLRRACQKKRARMPATGFSVPGGIKTRTTPTESIRRTSPTPGGAAGSGGTESAAVRSGVSSQNGRHVPGAGPMPSLPHGRAAA